MLVSILLSLGFISSPVYPLPAHCPSKAVPFSRDLNRMVEPVQYIEGSIRYLQKDYATNHNMSTQEAEANFNAVGNLVCNSKIIGSINVVGEDRSVLAFSAHMLWDDSCKPFEDLKKCKFSTVIDGMDRAFEISEILADGFKCYKPYRHHQEDWVVAKLAKPLPQKIKPFGIGDASKVHEEDEIMAINGANADMYEPGPNGKMRSAKTLENCKWKQHWAGLRATNCSTSFGSSGSGIFNGDRELLGINQSGSDTVDDVNSRIAESAQNLANVKPYNCGAYDPVKCASFYVPVEGEFRQALIDATTGVKH